MVHQSALADPCVSNNANTLALRELDGFGPRTAQQCQLTVPARERQLEATSCHLDVLRVSDEERRYRLCLAFEGQRRELFKRDRWPRQTSREIADHHLARLRRLFQSGCHVDGVAGHQTLAGRGVAGNHGPRVDANSDDDPHAISVSEVGGDRTELMVYVECGSHRAQRVVLVSAIETEHGHDCVTDEVLDGAAVQVERAPRRVERSQHRRSFRGGVHVLAQVRHLQIREHDRERSTALLPAVAASDRGTARDAPQGPVLRWSAASAA